MRERIEPPQESYGSSRGAEGRFFGVTGRAGVVALVRPLLIVGRESRAEPSADRNRRRRVQLSSSSLPLLHGAQHALRKNITVWPNEPKTNVPVNQLL